MRCSVICSSQRWKVRVFSQSPCEAQETAQVPQLCLLLLSNKDSVNRHLLWNVLEGFMEGSQKGGFQYKLSRESGMRGFSRNQLLSWNCWWNRNTKAPGSSVRVEGTHEGPMTPGPSLRKDLPYMCQQHQAGFSEFGDWGQIWSQSWSSGQPKTGSPGTRRLVSAAVRLCKLFFLFQKTR